MKDLCNLCPRKCGVNRAKKLGYCRAPREIMLARASLHFYEEPPISGTHGSGTLFFCGCNLRCVYCQNAKISRGSGENAAREVSEDELTEIMFRLKADGAHNINLVTPTHYADALKRVLEKIKPDLNIPIVYNCGGYESAETLKMLDGLIDIFMPDFKYFSPELSKKYSATPDYAERAVEALAEMYRQVGPVTLDGDGIMQKGLLVRHLVLPGCRKDSAEVLRLIAKTVPTDKIFLSIMRQYTPEFAPKEMRELRRRITSFEYDFVLAEAEKYGFNGFSQDKNSASDAFTPDFSEKTF
ncbi:MAG: radical SAM protein [Ruminococcaceae bacterium]|nr:radical SAM protein [Oscillospiraceae bacterium]